MIGRFYLLVVLGLFFWADSGSATAACVSQSAPLKSPLPKSTPSQKVKKKMDDSPSNADKAEQKKQIALVKKLADEFFKAVEKRQFKEVLSRLDSSCQMGHEAQHQMIVMEAELKKRFPAYKGKGPAPTMAGQEKSLWNVICPKGSTLQLREIQPLNNHEMILVIWTTSKNTKGIAEEQWLAVKEQKHWRIALPPKGLVKSVTRKDSLGKEVTVSLLVAPFVPGDRKKEAAFFKGMGDVMKDITKRLQKGEFKTLKQVQAASQKEMKKVFKMIDSPGKSAKTDKADKAEQKKQIGLVKKLANEFLNAAKKRQFKEMFSRLAYSDRVGYEMVRDGVTLQAEMKKRFPAFKGNAPSIADQEKELLNSMWRQGSTRQLREIQPLNKNEMIIVIWTTRKNTKGIGEQQWLAVKEQKGWRIELPPKGCMKWVTRKDSLGKEVTVKLLVAPFVPKDRKAKIAFFKGYCDVMKDITKRLQKGEFKTLEQVQAVSKKEMEKVQKKMERLLQPGADK